MQTLLSKVTYNMLKAYFFNSDLEMNNLAIVNDMLY